MTKKTIIAVCLLAAAGWTLAEQALTGKVLGQRVNLRAKADANSEVVGQVSEGDLLIVKGVAESWVEVRPPESIDLWVNRDLVADDKISVSKANVRAGPGINYSVVGTLARGDAVTSKGAFGEWVRIAPFDGASLWVNADLIEINYPLRPTSKPQPVLVVAEPAGIPPDADASTRVPPEPQPLEPIAKPSKPDRPTSTELIPLDGQGQGVSIEGILKPAPYRMSRPAPYRLARKVGNGYETVCYLRGNREQLEGLRDLHLRIKGKQYWVQGAREPLLVVESIQKLRVP